MSLKTWFLSTRPWSFTMSFIAVSVGSALAALTTQFDPWLYALTLGAVILFHAATNLLNDYYDVKHDVDQEGTPTTRYRPHPLAMGTLSPSHVLYAAGALYLLTVVIGTYLTLVRGLTVLGLGIAGLIVSVSYTADPLKLKHRGLGEFSVFLMWGPLMVPGAYYVQTSSVTVGTILASLPIGILVAEVLLANNTRDIQYDGSVGVKTLPVIIGKESALLLYQLLVVVVYAITGILVLLRTLPTWSLLTFLSLPKALDLLRTMRGEVPEKADPMTAQLTTIYGLLLIASLVGQLLLPIQI